MLYVIFSFVQDDFTRLFIVFFKKMKNNLYFRHY